MSISKIRSILYGSAKYLGDFSAILKSFKLGSINPLKGRIIRRIYGKFASRGFNYFK